MIVWPAVKRIRECLGVTVCCDPTTDRSQGCLSLGQLELTDAASDWVQPDHPRCWIQCRAQRDGASRAGAGAGSGDPDEIFRNRHERAKGSGEEWWGKGLGVDI